MGALLGFCGAEVLVRLSQDAPPGRIVGGQGGKGPWKLCIQCLDEAWAALGTHQVPPGRILETSRGGGCTAPPAPAPAASPADEKHFLSPSWLSLILC